MMASITALALQLYEAIGRMQGVVEVDHFNPPDEEGAWDFFVSVLVDDGSGWVALDWLSNLFVWEGGEEPPGLHLTAIGLRGGETADEMVVFDFFCEVDEDADLVQALESVLEFSSNICPNCHNELQDDITEIEAWLAGQSEGG
jgi:hypothetical protein